MPTPTSSTSSGFSVGDVASFALTIDGLAGDDALSSWQLASNLSGGDGNDTLAGGAGNDTLSGGNGIDTVDFPAR